ncbi:DoxX family protein [Actinomadura sp. KC06]|uniref:DoxX family protein n=1 Tax=Actinomadura sp. KC06 TaxID=2530369 RepID=UPI001047B8BD|nr:DoxX family protein [Actinomadura sp. KC06]TDD31583.1 DoxX family protein [Actinomadura sp. KC06]
MHVAYIVVTVVTILANAAIVVADLARARFVLANGAEVGVPQWSIPGLAALKAAGAAGLVLGLLGLDLIGIAAAAGLVAFFVGAVGLHLRTRVLHNIAFPGTYLALAVASLTLAAAQ